MSYLIVMMTQMQHKGKSYIQM